MIEHWDYLIIGAGFTGATLAERIASQLNAKVLIIDKRQHIGGNAWDEINQDGIRVGIYGAHIFHTHSEKIWRYITQFSQFNDFKLKVEASYQGQWYALPLNLKTINSFYNLRLE